MNPVCTNLNFQPHDLTLALIGNLLEIERQGAECSLSYLGHAMLPHLVKMALTVRHPFGITSLVRMIHGHDDVAVTGPMSTMNCNACA